MTEPTERTMRITEAADDLENPVIQALVEENQRLRDEVAGFLDQLDHDLIPGTRVSADVVAAIVRGIRDLLMGERR